MKAPSSLDQPRAIGAARLSVKARGASTRLDQLRQSGALKLLFPRQPRNLQAVIINTAGGITGGDQFTLDAQAGIGTHLTLTTQAAERVYRAQPGQTGQVRTTLHVAAGARLNWLPQETLLYDHGALDRKLTIDLEADARFLMVEPLLFGRVAMGEDIHELRFDDRVTLRREGAEIFRDGLHIWGDAAQQLVRPAIGNGARAMASILFAAPEASGHLTFLRAHLGPKGGASLLQSDLLVARVLASDGFALRQTILPILDHLTQNTLPASWRL